MIDQIVGAITSGEPLDLDDADLGALLEDADFRKALLLDVGEAMGFADQIDMDGPDAQSVIGSVDGAKEFLAGMMAMAAFSEMADEELVASEGPLSSEVHANAAPANCSPDELDAAMVSLSKSFFIEGGFSGNANVAGDLFGLPNVEFAELDVKWTGFAAPDPNDPFAGGQLSGDSFSERINLGDEDADPPATIDGKATLTLPVRFDAVQFAASETDQSKPVGESAGNVSATLVRCENDCVGVQIENLDREAKPVVVARDAAGQRLASTESMSFHKSEYTCNTRFTGTVANIEILIPAESATREVDITATKEPEWDGETYAPAAASRYDRANAKPTFVEMKAADLAAGIEVVPGRLNSSFEFNQPSVHCHLPQVDNSHLAKVEFSEATVEGEGGAVLECDRAGRGYKAEYHCESISFEDSTGEPVELSRVKGDVEVVYPLSVKVVTLTADAPSSDGLTAKFEGPMVSIAVDDEDADDDSPFDVSWLGGGFSDEIAKMQACDETGRPLKRLSYSGYRNGASFFAFWGAPTSLRLLRVTAFEKVNVPYDVPAAPKFDDDLAGVSGPRTACR